LSFSKAHLQSILKNPVYIGKFRYSGKVYQGLHQPLISEELFNHVQPFFKDKTRKLRIYKDYMLGGLVNCVECGSKMTPSHTNKGNMRRYYYYRCTKTFKQDWCACSTRQVNADRLEGFVIDNLKRISLDKHYLDSLIFKINFDGSRVRQGLEPTYLCSETVQKNLKEFVDYLEKASKIEQALIMRKYIKDILYSKESIQINLLCHPEVIDRQSIKNPAPLEESGVCGRARAAANPNIQVSFQKIALFILNRAILSMAPHVGLEAWLGKAL